MIIGQYIIILCSSIGLIIYSLKKTDGWRHILLAAIITSLWVSLSGIYSYRDTNLAFYSINLFPLFSWIGGLVLLKLVYDRIKSLKYLKAVMLYLGILLLAEYLGYWFLGIQLISNHPGLFGLELLHAPPYAQAYYLLAGPIYLIIANIFDKPQSNQKLQQISSLH